MIAKIELNRSTLSTGLIIIFSLVTIFGALISDFFQAPDQESAEVTRYRKLFDQIPLEHVNGLSISNNLGNFTFSKVAQGTSTSWQMTSPRKLRANQERLTTIFEALEKLKIRYVYQNDKINLSNFSLDNPLLTLNFSFDLKDQKPIALQLGLINPIDRSTYARISSNNAIYHIDALSIPLFSIGATELIDTRIFPHQQKSLQSVAVFRGKKSQGNIRLKIQRDPATKEWKTQNGQNLNLEKVTYYLQQLTETKSYAFLDQLSNEQLKQKEDILKNPQFSLEVHDQYQNTFRYHVSNPINSFPGINMKKRQFIMIAPEDGDHVYITNKAILKTFSLTQNRLQNLPVKKLFY